MTRAQRNLYPNMPNPNNSLAPQRKQATIVFADLSGFTAMSESLDPEYVREIVNRYFEALSAAVRRYEGTIDKYIGDCVMAVFGVPTMRESDCERACCAALDMQEAVRSLAPTLAAITTSPPEVHIGINTGLVIAGVMGSAEHSTYTVMGDAVNVASRLCHEAENGEIAVGEPSWELVKEKFNFSAKVWRSVKGKSERLPVYFLQSRNVKSSADRQEKSRMVGRTPELILAQGLLREACDRRGSLLYITGDPGIGKSRLSSEVSAWAGKNGMLTLAASAQPLENLQPYSSWRQLLEPLLPELTSTFAGDKSALRATAGLSSPELELLSDAERQEAIVRSWKEFLAFLQSKQPVLLIFDDLQWADKQSLQLLNEIVEFASQAALLVCAIARSEFRPAWQPRPHHHSCFLEPLSVEDSAEVIRAVLKNRGTGNHSPSWHADLLNRAEGNPFYLTQLARAADWLERGTLPPTVQGVIAEQIDRLEKDERQLLELASVIGREFSNKLLVAVYDSKQLEAQIDRLQNLELIYSKDIVSDLLYLFRHYLIQQATYEGILILRRKELHKKIAETIEKEFEKNIERHYAVLAQHYEKAGQYKLAFDYFRKAGETAQASLSEAAAQGLYERGEAALRMLYSDKPKLRNKLTSFWLILGSVLGSTCFSWGSLWLLYQTKLKHKAVPPHLILIEGLLLPVFYAILIPFLISSVHRWSFIVYPDRARLLSKHKTIDLAFEKVKKIQVVSYEHKFNASTILKEFMLWCDPRYPKYGWGQIGILRGTRWLIRVECRHGWRRGYTLDMEDPLAFLATFNLTLERYRATRNMRVAESLHWSKSPDAQETIIREKQS